MVLEDPQPFPLSEADEMSLAYASTILGRKFGSFGAVVSSGPSYDTDAAAYFTAVASAGGTITTANKTAFNTAFLSMKSTTLYDGSSLWSKIGQGYFFIGQETSSLTGLVVPFKGTYNSSNAVNNNFTSYSKTAGLAGNGSSTYIDTGINNNNNSVWPVSDRFGYVYMNPNNTSNGILTPFGTNTSNASLPRRFELSVLMSTGVGSGKAYNCSASTPTPANLGNIGGSVGGWGILSSRASGGQANCYFGSSGYEFACNNGTPLTASLVSGNIIIGGGAGSSFGSQNTMFAAFGEGIYGMGNGFDFQSFTALDSIVSTLISSLT
jgi:hypothetical protein